MYGKFHINLLGLARKYTMPYGSICICLGPPKHKNMQCIFVRRYICLSLIFSISQDYPVPPEQTDAPPELHSSGIFHHPTPVLTSGAHSRLSAATPTRPFSPFRVYTPVSASKARHLQSPASFRHMSPSVSYLSSYSGLLTCSCYS